MKILLTALNAKYIHTNLAVRYLKQMAKQAGFDVKIAEYTVNDLFDRILCNLYQEKPEILAFSCYLWNLPLVCRLCAELKKVLPATRIWVGGPEVSCRGRAFLEQNPAVELVMEGEGEIVFPHLLEAVKNRQPLNGVAGIWLWGPAGPQYSGDAAPVSMDELPFAYDDLDTLENRILYFESSRGCPFSCSYCLSSKGGARWMDPARACQYLAFFLKKRVRQVKFVDRTFNAKAAHCNTILDYLLKNDNGITNFHFEISADLLTDETIALIRQARPGLFQFEIGVQSANPETLRAIHRNSSLERLFKRTAQLKECGNCHLHLDLIAGLPFEGYDSFAHSYDSVFHAEPDMLQLGFLKVLGGSAMERDSLAYGILHQDQPPYEVLQTPWLTFEELIRLKGIDTLTDRYYNSGRFRTCLSWILSQEISPFRFFESFASYLNDKGLLDQKPGKFDDYRWLLQFYETYCGKERKDILAWRMRHDIFCRENAKGVPDFIPRSLLGPTRLEMERRWKDASWRMRVFPEFSGRMPPQEVHLEKYPFHIITGEEGSCTVLYDYRQRDLYGNARIVVLNDDHFA